MKDWQIKGAVFYILSKDIMTYEDTQFLNEHCTYEMILDFIETTGEAVDADELLDDNNTFYISAKDLVNFK
jgi:hypothetical protein